ncbi:unnamed protein product [Ilex paraguariensis]|uniref:Uncharacterized protein n=1 Tax=Ilex paraguariensis TaxID=185542 RepID=A0ABC8TV28_9AQUA
MAALSPALSNNSTDTPKPTNTTAAASTPPSTNASKNLRGLNKPKCIQCGNVARSSFTFEIENWPFKYFAPIDVPSKNLIILRAKQLLYLDLLSFLLATKISGNPYEDESQLLNIERSETVEISGGFCCILSIQLDWRAVALLMKILKGNSTFPDKAPSSNSSLFHQQSIEVSPSGNSLRVASLRQLSNNFAQFNNLQTPLRSRKPLTRKDAAVINEWRFLKLKEFKESNIEVGNKAFDSYMHNISLLEEVFSVNSTLVMHTEDGSSTENANSNVEDRNNMGIEGLKLKLRSNPIRTENFRKRMQYIIDQGLRKVRKFDSSDGDSGLNEQDELVNRPKKIKSWRAERASVMNDLIDKLNKARNEEDLKACLEMKSQLYNQHTNTSQVDSEDIEASKQQNTRTDLSSKQQSVYSPQKWFSTSTINQDVLHQIDAQFSSLEEIEDL